MINYPDLFQSQRESMRPHELKAPSALLRRQLSSSYVLPFTHSCFHTFSFLTVPCCAARRGQSDQNGSYLGLGNHQCQRDACMWLGVESRHVDTLQTFWNEVRKQNRTDGQGALMSSRTPGCLIMYSFY